MVRRGHTIHLLTETPGSEFDQVSPPAGAGTIGALRCLWGALRRHPAEIIHVHYAAGYGAWLAGACGRSPLVVSVMGGDILPEEQVPQNLLECWLTRRLLRGADLVTSKSIHLTERLTRMGVEPHRILPLVWGIDLSRFQRRDQSSLRSRLELPPMARVVLSPRALRPFYNIHVIVEAFAIVATDHPDAVLVITGHQADLNYQADLHHRVERLGLMDRVRFVGAIGADEMADFYSLAEAVVSVPPSDGIPQSLLEALACGAPTILSDLPHYREWVENDISALMTAITPAALAATLDRLLRDKALGARLAAAGPTVIAKGGCLESNLKRLDDALAQLPVRVDAKLSVLTLSGLAMLVVVRAIGARLLFRRKYL